MILSLISYRRSIPIEFAADHDDFEDHCLSSFEETCEETIDNTGCVDETTNNNDDDENVFGSEDIVSDFNGKLGLGDDFYDEERLDYETFLDTDLIRELSYVFLKEHGVKKTLFARHILKLIPSTFDNQMTECAIWESRIPKVKKNFHRLKVMISKKPYSEEMKKVESQIYKQRIETLIHSLKSSECTLEFFANNYLKISLSDFEKLMNDCLQMAPLDDNAKAVMNSITAFIIKKQRESRCINKDLKRKVKGNLLVFLKRFLINKSCLI